MVNAEKARGLTSGASGGNASQCWSLLQSDLGKVAAVAPAMNKRPESAELTRRNLCYIRSTRQSHLTFQRRRVCCSDSTSATPWHPGKTTEHRTSCYISSGYRAFGSVFGSDKPIKRRMEKTKKVSVLLLLSNFKTL